MQNEIFDVLILFWNRTTRYSIWSTETLFIECRYRMTTYELRLATDCFHNNGVFRTMIFFN